MPYDIIVPAFCLDGDDEAAQVGADGDAQDTVGDWLQGLQELNLGP